MFAVVELNDKQHLIKEGDVLTVDGAIDQKSISVNKVLLFKNDKKTFIGAPYLDNVNVDFSVLEAGKRDKDIVFKFKRKTGYKVTRGHRQPTSVLKVKKITFGDKK